jgi:hypothetical protein
MRRYSTTRPHVVAAVVAVASALAAPATARAADPSIAVLGLEAVEVPENLAGALTDALRQRAAATAGVRVLPAKDLIEIKMVFGCDENAPSCMAQAGRSLSADKLLYGTLRKGKGRDGISVALKLLDVKLGAIERQVNDEVPRRSLAPGAVQQMAARYFAQLVPVTAKPVLTVTSTPVGATVEVDGQPAGTTPVTLRELAPGSHELKVTMAGRKPFARTIELRPGGNFEVAAPLEAEAVATTGTPAPTPTPPPPGLVPEPKPATGAGEAEAKRTGKPGRTAKILAITAWAGAVVAGAVAIYTWRTYAGLEDTAHKSLENVRAGLGRAPNADEERFFQKPTCEVPMTVPGSPAVEQYKNDCSSGNTFANATTALWVVAGTLAAAGVVGYVVGDRQAAKAAEKPGTKTAASVLKQSLQIAPVFSSQGGGLQAAFEF